MGELMPWIGFLTFILFMLFLDLGIFHRTAHVIKFREALIWTIVWVTLALGFSYLIYEWKGASPALEFLTGYIVEKSLSVDNIFVFVLIFNYFSVPLEYQHRVLFWGILGAIIMRGIFILIGVELIKHFNFIFYFFGVLLIYTSYKMFKERHEYGIKTENPLLDWIARVLPLTQEYIGQKFFIVQKGVLYATPLFFVLVSIEISDLIFAIDSIPAIFAITQDPFIIFTSNIFAILGLRSMYVLLADLVPKFYYLRHGLSIILGFVGLKMLIHDWLKIPTWLSLGFILMTLGISVTLSIVKRRV